VTAVPHEIITNFNRKDEISVFECTLDTRSESLLEEECTEDGKVVSLRFRSLTNPPPILLIERYSNVKAFRVSCSIPVAWMFGVFVQLPSLETVAFGTGCFEEEKYTWPEQYSIKLERCPHVKELKIDSNIVKFHGLNEEGQKLVKRKIYAILDNARTSFPQLEKVDFVMPGIITLERFLTNYPTLKSIGLYVVDNAAGRMAYKANVRDHLRKKSAQRSRRSSTSSSNSRRTDTDTQSQPPNHTTAHTSSRPDSIVNTASGSGTGTSNNNVHGSVPQSGGKEKKRKKVKLNILFQFYEYKCTPIYRVICIFISFTLTNTTLLWQLATDKLRLLAILITVTVK